MGAGHIGTLCLAHSRRKVGAQNKPYLFAQTLEAQGTTLLTERGENPLEIHVFRSQPSANPGSAVFPVFRKVHAQNRGTGRAKDILLLFRNHLIPISPRTVLVLETVYLRKLEVTKEHVL